MIIDFHIHSRYSFDCFLEPQKIIDLARKSGVQGLAITDHDTMAGVEEFRRLAPDLYIIAGEEISTKDGDILGLFLQRELKDIHNADEALLQIRAQGGLAVLAHPFKWPHLRRNPDFLKRFDAIEVFNARNNIPSPYLENFLAYHAVKSLNLAYLAGSDTHEGVEIGQAGTVFNFSEKDASDEKIKQAIISKQVSVRGKEISLPFEIVSHFSRMFKSFRQK